MSLPPVELLEENPLTLVPHDGQTTAEATRPLPHVGQNFETGNVVEVDDVCPILGDAPIPEGVDDEKEPPGHCGLELSVTGVAH